MVGGIKKKHKNHRRHKKNKNKKGIQGVDPPKAEAVHSDDEDDELAGENHGDKEPVASKRPHDDDDSDTEDKPKRKKKKKPIQAEPTDGNKKGKKSIRQIKKEKYLQRLADAEAAQKDELKTQCLNYISQWEHDRSNWKFMKAKQVWLTKNKFSPNLVPDVSWPILLKYFESAKGNVRTTVLSDANKVIKQMDEWTEKNGASKGAEEDDDEESDITKPNETSYKRARDLIQCLQE